MSPKVFKKVQSFQESDMLSKPVYEMLPYVYVACGSISLFSLDNGLGKTCGLLLITSGVIIHQLRAQYRKVKKCR
jgi:hypothetical protein